MKKLVACGCSFTNGESEKLGTNLSEYWPEFLAKDLGLECINDGRGGIGNDYIFHRAIEHITNDQDEMDCLCVLWTQIFRVDLWNWCPGNYISTLNPLIRNRSLEVRRGDHDLKKTEWQQRWEIDRKSIEKIFRDNLSYHCRIWLDIYITNFFSNIIILQKLCNKLGIKLIMGQAMRLTGTMDDDNNWCMSYFIQKMSKEVLDVDIIYSATSHCFNTKHFIGWPIVPQLGGYAFQEHGQELWKLENRISDIDWHPNEKGHRIIANEFLKKYKEIYS